MGSKNVTDWLSPQLSLHFSLTYIFVFYFLNKKVLYVEHIPPKNKHFYLIFSMDQEFMSHLLDSILRSLMRFLARGSASKMFIHLSVSRSPQFLTGCYKAVSFPNQVDLSLEHFEHLHDRASRLLENYCPGNAKTEGNQDRAAVWLSVTFTTCFLKTF